MLHKLKATKFEQQVYFLLNIPRFHDFFFSDEYSLFIQEFLPIMLSPFNAINYILASLAKRH
jgi:hypothetical protein